MIKATREVTESYDVETVEEPTLVVVPFKAAGIPAATSLIVHDETSFDTWYGDVVSNCDSMMEVKLMVAGQEKAAAFFDTRATQSSTLCPRHVKDALALHKYLTVKK
jgi:hypothetical protein